MASRTPQTVVHFSNSFLLPGIDEPQRAGDYPPCMRKNALKASPALNAALKKDNQTP